MQNFIKLQNVLNDSRKSFVDFKQELINSDITELTYLCLLLNIAATIKRPNFHFELYLQLLINFKKESGFKAACINYKGYKDKICILMNACQKSLASTVHVLANHSQIKINTLDPNGYNAIYYAIKNTDQNEGLKILEILKDISPQMLTFCSNPDSFPLLFAVQRYRLKIIQFLLRNQCDPNQKIKSTGNTSLYQFIKNHSKYNLQQIKRIFEIFLRFGYDFNLKNNQEKTIAEYASQFHLYLYDILGELTISEENSLEINSSKRATTKNGEVFTNCNFSEIQGSDYYQIDTISQNSLISDMNGLNFKDERIKEFSVDYNVNQSQQYEQNLDFEDQIFQRKIQCQSESDSKRSKYSHHNSKQFEVSFSSEQSSGEDQNDFVKTQQINYEQINTQLININQINEQLYMRAISEFEPFFHKIAEIAEPFGLYIQIIGSFATGLWTQDSDIDISLVAISPNFINFQRLLQSVYIKIKFNHHALGIKNIGYNKCSKIPSIKIDMDQYLYSCKKIDIMIFHKKNMGIVYVNFIRQNITIFPQIKPIFLYLKKVCKQYKLHDPLNGGLKSYSIFLMVLFVVKSFEYKSLGELLLKLALYYGFYHNYTYDFDLNASGEMENINQPQPILRINIQDPLNIKNNMGGKTTDTNHVINMFRSIYYGLHKNIKNGSNLEQILERASII